MESESTFLPVILLWMTVVIGAMLIVHLLRQTRKLRRYVYTLRKHSVLKPERVEGIPKIRKKKGMARVLDTLDKLDRATGLKK